MTRPYPGRYMYVWETRNENRSHCHARARAHQSARLLTDPCSHGWPSSDARSAARDSNRQSVAPRGVDWCQCTRMAIPWYAKSGKGADDNPPHFEAGSLRTSVRIAWYGDASSRDWDSGGDSVRMVASVLVAGVSCSSKDGWARLEAGCHSGWAATRHRVQVTADVHGEDGIRYAFPGYSLSQWCLHGLCRFVSFCAAEHRGGRSEDPT
ncbi:hypothetical protein B0H14DRAFT_1617207 [Mycena olivaceomarginata]|nr:hypothetical protein B0H14DRAFT_1617207 [Mycena olivaceomarginata]